MADSARVLANAAAIFASSVIDDHIPSLSDADDAEIDAILDRAMDDPENADNADLAGRTCHCGVAIDGFYKYVDHLKEVLRAAAQT